MATQLTPKPRPRKKLHEKEQLKRDSLRKEMRRQGGYDCQFVEQPPQYLQSECPICLMVLRDPHQVSCCGNSFCGVCIEVVQASSSPCPTCKNDSFSAFQDKRLQRSLYAFRVRCPHVKEGCQWTGELGELGKHLNKSPGKGDELVGCEFVEVECIYCMEPFQRCSVSDHQVRDCNQRPFSCDFCGSYQSSYEEVVGKHWPVCGYHPVPCPNECGVYPERQNLEHHVSKHCPLTIVRCDFHYAGCEVQLLRKDMPAHLVEGLAMHLPLIATCTKQMLPEREQMEKENEIAKAKQEQEIEALWKSLAERNTEIAELIVKFEGELEQSRQKIERMETENKKMKAKQEQEIAALRKGLAEKNTEIAQLQEELSAVALNVKEVEDCVSLSKDEETEASKPKKESDSRFQMGGLLRHSLKKERKRQEIAGLKAKYEEHNSSIAELIAKQEKDRSSLETLESYTGSFPVQLTMTDVQKHMTYDDTWFSKPFYTHPHGYKMCLKVAVNGRRKGAGTHISVYIYLMRGEFDDHLRWPFQGQVTVQLINQAAKDECHHTATISFSNTQHSSIDVAGRVVGTERASDGIGQPKFLPLEELGYSADKNCQYLKDDCLCFEIARVTDADRTVQLERQCLEIESRVCIPPIEFTMSDIDQQKNENAAWYSPSFYAHQRGYRMSLHVFPNGIAAAKDTHVSVYVCLVRGEFDEYLKWPFRGDITIQLLNQREDKNHHEITARFTDTAPDDIAGRVTRGMRANPWGKSSFISHDELGYNRDKNCQYLKDDCLQFRVAKVEMKN